LLHYYYLYIFLIPVFIADTRNTIKKAIIIGAKTSNQLVVPIQIFMIKSTALKSTAKEIKISLKPIFLAAAFLVLLLANG